MIPYTSIIEQNADVFRRVLGNRWGPGTSFQLRTAGRRQRSRLPLKTGMRRLIVTTNVQFFESLFGSRTSQCRKLHNIAQSVIILDEAQMLPVPLLKPSLEALRELSSIIRNDDCPVHRHTTCLVQILQNSKTVWKESGKSFQIPRCSIRPSRKLTCRTSRH